MCILHLQRRLVGGGGGAVELLLGQHKLGVDDDLLLPAPHPPDQVGQGALEAARYSCSGLKGVREEGESNRGEKKMLAMKGSSVAGPGEGSSPVC